MTIPTAPGARRPSGPEVERAALDVYVIRLEGTVDVTRARQLGHQLLGAVADGCRRLLLDLERAQPHATGALLGVVLRMDRHATRHDARLVVVSGPATEAMFRISHARDLMTIVDSIADARAALAS